MEFPTSLNNKVQRRDQRILHILRKISVKPVSVTHVWIRVPMYNAILTVAGG